MSQGKPGGPPKGKGGTMMISESPFAQPGAPQPPAPDAGGYGAPPAQGGYGAPPAPGGFGAPQGGQPGGFGAPPAGQPGGFGAPQQGGFGGPPGGQPPGGYGGPPGPQPGGFGGPPGPQPGGFGGPPGQQPGGFGAPPDAGGYGAPQGGFGAPQGGQGGFGAPQGGGFGGPNAMAPAPMGGGAMTTGPGEIRNPTTITLITLFGCGVGAYYGLHQCRMIEGELKRMLGKPETEGNILWYIFGLIPILSMPVLVAEARARVGAPTQGEPGLIGYLFGWFYLIPKDANEIYEAAARRG